MAELRSLRETAHLLRSPANALRLLEALRGSLHGEGVELTLEALAETVGVPEPPRKRKP